MGWIITAAYALIWILYGWRLTVCLLDAHVSTYPDPVKAAQNWLGMYLYAGFGLALFWPVVAPVRGLYRAVGTGGLFRTPTEAAYAERVELEALRKQARALDLPMPWEDA